MKLQLNSLSEGENRLEFRSGKHAWLKELSEGWASVGAPVQGETTLELTLTNLEPEYFLRGKLSCLVQRDCSRCAEDFPLTISHRFELGLVHIGRRSSKEPDEDLDVEYFQGEFIDLAPIVEEQFQLSLPYIAVCGPEKDGVFPCGRKRAELPYLSPEEAEEEPETKESPFAVLKDLKTTNKSKKE